MRATQHRRTGDALGYACEVDELVLRCGACGHMQTEVFDSDASVRDSVAVVTCGACGRAGAMRMWRAS